MYTAHSPSLGSGLPSNGSSWRCCVLALGNSEGVCVSNSERNSSKALMWSGLWTMYSKYEKSHFMPPTLFLSLLLVFIQQNGSLSWHCLDVSVPTVVRYFFQVKKSLSISPYADLSAFHNLIDWPTIDQNRRTSDNCSIFLCRLLVCIQVLSKRCALNIWTENADGLIYVEKQWAISQVGLLVSYLLAALPHEFFIVTLPKKMLFLNLKRNSRKSFSKKAL